MVNLAKKIKNIPNIFSKFFILVKGSGRVLSLKTQIYPQKKRLMKVSGSV